MKIVNRERSQTKQGFVVNKSGTKVKLPIDINVLDLMCSFSVCSNRNLKRSHFISLRNLIEALDLAVFQNDRAKMDRIEFIRKTLDLRLNKGIVTPALLIAGYMGGMSAEDEAIQKLIDGLMELSNQEIDFINQIVSGGLKRTYLENSVDRILDIATRYKTADFRNSESIIAEWEEAIKSENNRLRSARVESVLDTTFTLRPDKFNDIISDIYDTVTNPSRLFWTGMQGFNMLVGDALESTRVYLLLGLAGVGKSLTLLDLALQIKKYNAGHIPKDPTKIPTILYLTQENTVEETVERIFSMFSGGGKMKNYTKEEVKEILLGNGLFLTEEDNINIIIMYRPDCSIDTSDLYTIIEDLEDDGYEVIMLLQDHIKRVMPVSHNPDIRLRLGEVTNEFKVLAQLKQIPVISVAHLNRDAAKTVDDNARGNKQDMTRLLGRANIGESMLMIDNADCVIIINVEYDSDGRKHMVFKGIKLRNAACARDYICQPYEENNSSKLMEDFGLATPLFKDALATVQQAPVNMNRARENNLQVSAYTGLTEMDDNIFTPSGNSYGFMPGTVLPTTDMFSVKIPENMPSLNISADKVIAIQEMSMEISEEVSPLIVFTKDFDESMLFA